jgi:hypothetical protein
MNFFFLITQFSIMQGLTRTQLLLYSITDCTLGNVNGTQQPVTTMLGFIHPGLKLVTSERMPVCNLPNPVLFETYSMYETMKPVKLATHEGCELPHLIELQRIYAFIYD